MTNRITSNQTLTKNPPINSTQQRRIRRKRTKERINSEHADSLILNETGHILSHQQQLAIIRGTSFIPTRPIGRRRVQKDLDKLRRNINLRLFWATNRQGNNSVDHSYKRSLLSSFTKSSWHPPNIINDTNPLWTAFTSSVINCSEKPVQQQNIPLVALRGWDELTTSPHFFLVTADKGGKLVLWRRQDYYNEAYRQLNDPSVYTRLDSDEATRRYAALSNVKYQLLTDLRHANNITRNEAIACGRQKGIMPSFYLLPKAHKATRPFVGRPILAATHSVFKSLDQYMSKVCATLLPAIPGSYQDSPELIRALEKLGPLPANASLFSADVEALYPSIPLEEGISSAVKFYAMNFHLLTAFATNHGLLPPPKPKLFKRILEAILYNNIFTFRGSTFYIQISGIAMGSSLSVYIANCFMFYRTRDLILRPPVDLLFLGRYIDDLIAITTAPIDRIPSFFSSTIDDHIKLTFVFTPADGELAVLDFLAKLVDGRVSVRLYRKPIDGHQYLHWSSSHPRHTLRGIPYGQMLRYRRNCTRDEDFTVATAQLLQRFQHRGYPAQVLCSALSRAVARPRSAILAPVPPRRHPEAVFVTTFNQDSDRTIRQAANTFWTNLRQDETVSNMERTVGHPILPERLCIAYRAGKSLGSKLIPILKYPCMDHGRAEEQEHFQPN